MQTLHLNLNGRLLPPDSPVFPASNRGFRYGDGLFETMLFDGKNLPLIHVHWQRLSAGMKALCLNVPMSWNAGFFDNEIRKVTSKGSSARIRLSVFRTGGGWFAPETDEPAFLIEAFPFSDAPVSLLQVGLIEQVHICPNPLGLFKTSNSLAYVLASRIRKENRWEEGIIMNQQGRISDGCHSNVFAMIDGVLVSPPVSEGAVAGVMRSVVMEIAEKKGRKVEIRSISRSDLDRAVEIWFSNALTGVRWVEEFGGRRLGNTLWREFFQKERGLWENIPEKIKWIDQ